MTLRSSAQFFDDDVNAEMTDGWRNRFFRSQPVDGVKCDGNGGVGSSYRLPLPGLHSAGSKLDRFSGK